MNTRIFKIYMLIVISIISIVPLFYFLRPDLSNFNFNKPDDYRGLYHNFQGLDDIRLFARIRQKETTHPYIIFLQDNSLQANYALENHLADSLENFFTIVSPDYRSTGKSERLKNPYKFSLESYVNDVEALRLSLKTEKISILGHGFGALLAKLYRTYYPENCDKIFMINPIPEYNSAAQRTAKKIAERFAYGPDDMRPMIFFDMNGYATEEEIGFFATMKILVSAEYFKVNYKDTVQAEKNNIELAVKSSFYTEDEIYSINQASHVIGFLFSFYKSSQKESFANAHENDFIIIGSEDSWTDKKTFSSIGYRLKEVNNSAFYPYLDNPQEFYHILLSELRSK